MAARKRRIEAKAVRPERARERAGNADDRPVELIYEADPDGRPVVHERIVDNLELMLRRGVITAAMWNAGRAFQHDFRLAALDRMPLPKLMPLPGGGVADLTGAQIDARRRIAEALRVLGGAASPVASCVWCVIGEERSLSDFVRRQSWSGRSMNRHTASGLVLAGLAVLAPHYGYERA